MNFLVIVLCLLLRNVQGELNSKKAPEVGDNCCKAGQAFAMTSPTCAGVQPPDDVEEVTEACLGPLRKCCEQQQLKKVECDAGIDLAPSRRCSMPNSDISRMCCDECTYGVLAGESQGLDGCGEEGTYGFNPTALLRSNTYYRCCVEASENVETATEERTTKRTTSTTAKSRENCKPNSCEHECSDAGGLVRCQCREGFRLQPDNKSCKDIDECEESSDICKRTEVCINLPGAYNCKSKISAMPKLTPKTTCQEGTRTRPEGVSCEDIDECREGTHLCDQFQNCINTFGSHECQCKKGFELDSSSGSCTDVDECALKLDNCAVGMHCQNVLGSFTCTRQPVISTTLPTTSTTKPTTTTLPPTTTPKPTTTARPTTKRPTTTSRPTRPPTTTKRPMRPPTKPQRPTTVKPYEHPYQPRPNAWRPDYPPNPNISFVDVPKPNITAFIESERNPDGSYDLDIGNIPEGTWTNVVGRDPKPAEDPNRLSCLNGYKRNERGECVDTDECKLNRQICGPLKVCKNTDGGYYCVPESVPTTPRTTPRVPPRTTTVRTTTPRRTTTSTTTSTTTTKAAPTYHEYYTPPSYGYRPPTTINCNFGYIYSANQGRCIDIDECTTNKAACATNEDCVNSDGGYKCVCGGRCRSENGVAPYGKLPRFYSRPKPRELSVITVRPQYGTRGGRYVRPTVTREPGTGEKLFTCPWGYSLTPDRFCIDIDECACNISECGPEQRCENFYGGYSCQCPPGHRHQNGRCEDIDECGYANTCPYNSRCVNTVGSYKCECGEGFQNAPSNDKVCVDVDECAQFNRCNHGCVNFWGGYRCFCNRGYRLQSDNRTCADVDECAEYSSGRSRLCGGLCVNTAGSYRCACPPGYRLGDDLRCCIARVPWATSVLCPSSALWPALEWQDWN